LPVFSHIQNLDIKTDKQKDMNIGRGLFAIGGKPVGGWRRTTEGDGE
jgi:hypothetical protein